MKRGFFITLLFWVGAAGAASRAPRIEFEQTEHSFGAVTEGQTVEHDFIFRNTGTATLTISAVNTSCGCTSAVPTPKRIKPGKEGKIHVSFDSAGRAGSAHKSIRVFSDDPGNKMVVLRLAGEVQTIGH